MAFSIPIHFVGKPVRSLQTMLRMISQYAEEIPTVIPDGIYADSTAACVIALQKRHGLPMTGETDFHTWTVIAKEYRRAVLEIGPAESIHPILQPKEAIRAQEVNQNLFMIHGMLWQFGSIFPLCRLSSAITCTMPHRLRQFDGCRFVRGCRLPGS